MNKEVSFLFIWLALSGCLKAPTVDVAIRPYYDRFESYCHISPYNVSGHFGLMDDPDDIGYCQPQAVYNYIVIDRKWWKANPGDLARESLIFHELGHCVLNRGHDERLMNIGLHLDLIYNDIPRSIMFPNVIGGWWFYKTYHNYYIQELCNANFNR